MKKIFVLWMIASLFVACEKEKNETSQNTQNLYRIEKDDVWGFINDQGDTVIEPQFEAAQSFYYEKAAVKVDGKWGYINETGEMEIEPRYMFAYPFTKDGFTAVCMDGFYGFIDDKGEVIIDFEYNFVRSLYEGYAVVRKDNKYGIIDLNGKEVIPFEYDDASGFRDGFAFVAKGSDWQARTWAIINKQGELITDFVYEMSYYDSGFPYAGEGVYPSFSEGLAPVKYNDKYCYINTNGEVVLETDFDYVVQFSEGLASVGKDGLFGFIDKTGAFVIEPSYRNFTTFFNDGYAPAKNDDQKYGIINQNNEIIIPFEYAYCTNFKGELAQVRFEDNSWGYINKENEVVWRSAVTVSSQASQADIFEDSTVGFNPELNSVFRIRDEE